VDDGQRAKALLEGAVAAKPAASDAQGGRFVVQVGAYTDSAALREARQKVEKLGLKTYTQVVDTEGGPRTRVRVGPFATRDEAAVAGRTLKAAGLPANILVL
jgi:DedD protein